MKKKYLLLVLTFILGSFIITIMLNQKNIATSLPDISNLEIENNSETFEIISFEDAVRLYSKLSNTIDRVSEEKLNKTENDILLSGGTEIKYYQFTGEFAFTDIKGLDGLMTTLIIVVEQPERYIYMALDPLTKVSYAKNNINWVQMDSSATIEESFAINDNKSSVRLAAMGYIEIIEKDIETKYILSNTIYPTFTFSLENIK